MDEVMRQRIRYLIEHGELYPVEKHLERSLAVKMFALLALLQALAIIVTLWK